MSASPVSLVPAPGQGPVQTVNAFGVGASESAVAIGVSEYRPQIAAWLVKTGRAAPFAGNDKTEWGHRLEPAIRQKYSDLHNVPIYVPPTSLYHARHPFIRATPDGIVIDSAGRWLRVAPQVKNVGFRMIAAWKGPDGEWAAPIDYYIQAIVELAVTDLPKIEFAVLGGGSDYFEVTIERDAEIEADVIEQLVEFWRLVETDTQPELDDSETFRAHLLGKVKRRAHIAASPSSVIDIERWKEIAIDIAKLKREESALKNRIAEKLAEANAHRMTSDLGDITIGAGRKKTAWKAVAAELARSHATLVRVIEALSALAAEPDMLTVASQLDVLTAQLRLAVTPEDYVALVARHTSVSNPSINRPRGWTKSVIDADGDYADDSNEES